MVINTQTKFRLITASLFASFITIGFGFYFLQGIVGKVKYSKIKLAEINRDIALMDKVSQENKQYSDDIQNVVSTLPSEYYEVSFFTTQLERLAQENGLSLKISIDKDKKEESKSYNSIVYSLEIIGGYPAISEFLSQISKLPYHTFIDKIRIASEESGLLAKINFRLFVQK